MDLKILGLALCLQLAAQVIARPVMHSYDYIKYFEFNRTSDFITEYFQNGKVDTNIMVAFATPKCADYVYNSAPIIGSRRHAGSESLTIAIVIDDTFVIHPYGCAEAYFFPYGSTLSDLIEHISIKDSTDKELVSWVTQRTYVHDFTFYNEFNYPLQVFWCDENSGNNPVFYIPVGTQMTITTHIGHIFAARHVKNSEVSWDAENPLVDYMTVKESNYHFKPQNRLETCDIDSHIIHKDVKFVAEAYDCSNLDMRFIEYSQQIWYENRLGANYFQPKLVQPITKEGFKKIKMPISTYTWLKSWYQHEQSKLEELEGSAGPCMNQQIAPSGITHLEDDLKERLSIELQGLMEEWGGLGPLQLTSIYGIRKYTNGSILRMHVDTVSTHAISAIINVDQSVRSEWPLLILDHWNEEHNVSMIPGDMVLYESARLLHGRPTSFDGDHYDNIFIHYKPVHGWHYEYL